MNFDKSIYWTLWPDQLTCLKLIYKACLKSHDLIFVCLAEDVRTAVMFVQVMKNQEVNENE